MQTVISTKVNGRMVRQMDRESLWILMDRCMRVNGWMISNMDLELSHGNIIKSNSLVILSTARRQEREGLNLRVAFTKEISLMDSSMDSESITSLTQANFMKEASKTTIWKVKV